MRRKQKIILVTLAATYALVVVAVEFLYAFGVADPIHAAADVATVANSIGIPVTILVGLLTTPAVGQPSEEGCERHRDREHDQRP